MDDPIFTELRKLVGQHEKIVYEAVKADTVAGRCSSRLWNSHLQ
jgi:hypothetical protein